MPPTSPYRLPDPSLEALLGEDTPAGDATTFALGIGDAPGVLEYRARGPMTLCGSEEAARMGQLRELTAVGPVVASGSVLEPGQLILRLEGRAADLHAVWKTSQTLMESLSGIASATAAIVAATRQGNPSAAVACTRKNFPGTKAAAIKAILCGGAAPHRLSLSETLLVFAEHRAFLDEPPAATVARLRRSWPERRIVIEVSDEAEAVLWLEAGIDVLQLEKLPVEAVARIVAIATRMPRPPLIAAAGGVNASNAEDFARAGAGVLVTSSPYFAPPRDVAVTLRPAR